MKTTSPPACSFPHSNSSAPAAPANASARNKKPRRQAAGLLRSTRPSVRVLPRLFDDRLPLGELRREVLLQVGGRRLLERNGLGAEIGEALLHRRILERELERLDELV